MTELQQVGWMGPYGIIPGGLDVDAAAHWQPLYVKPGHELGPFTGVVADLVGEWMEDNGWPVGRETEAWSCAYAVVLLCRVPFGWMTERARERAIEHLALLPGGR